MNPSRLRSLLLLPAAVLLLVAPLPGTAQSDEVVLSFDEGIRRYEAQEYDAALESFQAAESSGLESAALHYNLGNTYFRLNQLGRSILHYERARRLAPDDPRIRHNLRIAAGQTVDRFSRVPDPIWTSLWNRIVALVRPEGIFAIGLLLFLFGVGLSAQRIWSGTRNDWIRRGIVVGLAAGTLLLSGGLWASRQSATRNQAVVLDTSAQIHDEPHDQGRTVVQIHEGLVVDVVERQEAWSHIRLPNGVTGWVESEAIEPV